MSDSLGTSGDTTLASTEIGASAREFRRLAAEGAKPGLTRRIGMGFVHTRDALARFLLARGVRPNHLTVAGFLATCGAAYFFVRGAGHHAPYEAPIAGVGASWFPMLACVSLVLAGACDILDGAVARLGSLSSSFGAVLDSVADRLSEVVLYTGTILHFAVMGNMTYTLLAVMAMCNGLLISYVKARAENMIGDCSVGFWFRGERHAALVISALFSHIPTLLWQQAIFPFFTVLRRAAHTAATLEAQACGLPAPSAGPRTGRLRYLTPWRFPRGSIPYDIITFTNIVALIALPWLFPWFYGHADPVGHWLRALLSAG